MRNKKGSARSNRNASMPVLLSVDEPLMSVSDTWSDWDTGAMTPAPLPSFPAPSGAADPVADVREPAATPAHLSKWSLVSSDGRATMRLPNRFVVGRGSCCDLRLSEQ